MRDAADFTLLHFAGSFFLNEFKMNILCIFAKPPIPGKTKRRLAESIGDLPAAELSKIMLNFLINEGRSTIADKIFLYIPTESKESDFEDVDFNDLVVKFQVGENLGQKMANMFKANCQNNNKVLLIGSDCISHTSENLNGAFEALSSHEMVLQPAEDGGYVLIGQKEFCSEIFNGPKWGGSTVFQDTVQILKRLNASYFLLPLAFDIDVREDLKKLPAVVEKTNNLEIKKWLQKYFY